MIQDKRVLQALDIFSKVVVHGDAPTAVAALNNVIEAIKISPARKDLNVSALHNVVEACTLLVVNNQDRVDTAMIKLMEIRREVEGWK